MARKRVNKQHMEYIFLPTGNQAVKATGVLSAAGNSVNLANGQLGIVSADHNSATRPWGTFLQAGDTASTVDAVKIVMGTAYSSNTQLADGWGIKKPFLESPIIKSDNVRSYSASVSKLGTYGAQLFTSLNTPEELTLYKLYVELRSVRNDRTFGNNVQTLPATYETPEYTGLATITDTKAHLIQNILYKVNAHSKALATSPNWITRGSKPVIAFAIDVSGGSGTALGDIECGTSIPVQKTTRNGVAYTASYVADQDFVETVVDWIANTSLTVASTIELIDVATAGTAGTPAVDAFIIMGLENDLSLAYDDVYSTKVRPDVQLADGFRILPLYTQTKASDAFDGMGEGRQWRIRYDERAHGQKSLHLTGFKDNVIEMPLDNLDETKTYSAHIIDIFEEEDTLTVITQVQKRIIILLETDCDCVDAESLSTTYDLSATQDGSTYVFNGVTYEDDQGDDGVTQGNTEFDGTPADFVAKVEADNTGIRGIVDGTDVTFVSCAHVPYTTATNLDSILKVWLASTSLASKNIDSEFGSNYFALV